jgi:hypothetical protein
MVEEDEQGESVDNMKKKTDIDEEGYKVEDSCDNEKSRDINYHDHPSLEHQELEIGYCQIEIGYCQIEIEQLKQQVQHLTSANMKLRHILMSSLQKNRRSLLAVLKQMKLLQRSVFGARVIKDDDQKTKFCTGLENYKLFLCLFRLLQPLVKPDRRSMLIDEFFLVLMKLRLGVPNNDLAYRINVSEPYVSAFFHKWLKVMATELRHLIAWPNDFKIRQNMPNCFRKHFMSTKCIIDCFEIFIERHTFFQACAATYSNYKKHNTVKVLIAVAPSGSICFISKHGVEGYLTR